MKSRLTRIQCRQALFSLLVQRICRLKSARIETELRLAKRYWLETVQRFIAGRKLRGAELSVAMYAYRNLLRESDRNGRDWNDGGRRLVLDSGKLVIVKDNPGRDCLIPGEALVNWQDPLYAEPEPLYADDLKPEPLASLAASLLPKSKTRLWPDEAIRHGHNLLLAAERYIRSLPKRPPPREAFKEDYMAWLVTVTFKEIMASNRKGSGELPLLPPLQLKKKGKSADEITGTQSLEAIRKTVREFLERERPHVTEAEDKFEEEQNALLESQGALIYPFGRRQPSYQEKQAEEQARIDDCMENNRISVMNLCKLRWQRFRDFAAKQHRPA